MCIKQTQSPLDRIREEEGNRKSERKQKRRKKNCQNVKKQQQNEQRMANINKWVFTVHDECE